MQDIGTNPISYKVEKNKNYRLYEKDIITLGRGEFSVSISIV